MGDETLKKVLAAAGNLLVRREHSVAELRRKLTRKGYPDELVDSAIQQLLEKGYLSDSRFVEMYVRSCASRGQGSEKIRHSLLQHSIETNLINTHIDNSEFDWRLLAESARLKKFGQIKPENYKDWSKQARFLQQRGFSTDVINCVLATNREMDD